MRFANRCELVRASGAWLLAGFALLGPADREVQGADAPTYHKEVEAIIQRNCQDCHRPGQVAPFSLMTFEQARKRGEDIARVTSDRIMPPWPASTTYGGPFHDQRVLPSVEVDTLRKWVDAGCPEGDSADAPPARAFAGDWPLGPPDLIVTMPEAYELSSEGDDEFRAFVLRTDFADTRWIRAVDFKPGNRKVVHHVIAAVDVSGRGRELDAQDPKPGYVAVGGFGDGVPIRGFLPIWTPGSRPRFAPEGAGYVLPPKADILVQMHYHKTGKVESDQTQVGLYLSDKPLPKQLRTGFVFPDISPFQRLKLAAKFQAAKNANKRPTFDEMLEDVLVIPPGEAHYAIKGSTKEGALGRPLQRDVLITSVMPHMHWLGKDFTMYAVLPDGKETKVPLIKIDRWNFNWQGTYTLAEPVRLPKGTYLAMEANFDNSANNPANPSQPPKRVHWGEQTNDEMCIGIFEFVVADGVDPAAGAPRPAEGPKPEKATDASKAGGG